ncbi:hypothetical protein AQUCO_00100529v1 [Aquilegia coerulea]|uniref:Uncharacterized protein n=1 Tax=Aquilegia coerulea TaxID=218851 RepID=A0A2G5FAS7_AQUCA|nr:hypothetical protein AQUCO_00100529v1 [Aquilegia coerulea]
MEKEIKLLSKVTVNHLFLTQFEAFRATLLSLRKRNPSLSLAILQTVVSQGGKIKGILWSDCCSSPSLLAWLSALVLLEFDDASSIWNLDPDLFKLKVEFLLLMQFVSSRVSESIRKLVDLESIGKEEEEEEVCSSSESVDHKREDFVDLKGLNSEFVDIVNALDRISEFGLRRLKRVTVGNDDEESVDVIREDDLKCLTKLFLEQSDVFDAICCNIQKQVHWFDREDESGLAITVHTDEKARVDSEEEQQTLKLIQKNIQIAHLEALKELVKENDINGAISHLRFLHLDYGVLEIEYRTALQDLTKKIWLGRDGFGDTWSNTREHMLSLYGEALSSNCTGLLHMIQSIQDEMISEEIEMSTASDANWIPPLERLQNYLIELGHAPNLDNKDSYMSIALNSCKREMYHYARVSGVHVLECVLDAALSAVKKEHFQEASNVLSLFPLLQPLVAVMGWDLLSGKTAARKKMMQLLWTSKSQVLRLEEYKFHGKQSDEISCVEHLCDILCYHLDLSSFVACVNSGQSWDSKSSILLSGKERHTDKNDDSHSDPFVENFVLERLAAQTPLRVLFDVVPGIKYQDAMELISMQPIASTEAAWKRMQDIELMHMRYALESAVLAIGAMERSVTNESQGNHHMPLCYLKDLQNHLEAIGNIPRKIFVVCIVISLLHMDNISLNFMNCTSSSSYPESTYTSTWDKNDLPRYEEGNKMVMSFTGLLLEILHHCLPLDGFEQENLLNSGITSGGRKALDWRISNAKQFIEDWEWRLSILQRLLPLSERQWNWKEALTILRAAPSKLLNFCMQKAKFDIGEEAIHRFSLPPEDKATLELAEWVDGTFRKASVEDSVSRVAEGTSNAVQELDFASLRSQLGPLPAILLCIDVATSSARSTDMSKQLLNQAQVMLSEIYPGGSPKIGSTYWDQIHEVGIISVTRRILKRLHEYLEQENSSSLQSILSGETIISSSIELNRQGQKQRALAILHQMIEDAHRGKRQFLSGKLHNLARAVADEEIGKNYIQGDGGSDQKMILNFDRDGVLGLGLNASKTASFSSPAGENVELAAFETRETGKRLFGPLSSKPATYLSAFILYIATIGDIVDGIDSTHDFNFFSLVYEWPKDLLTRLVFERGSTDAAGKVAEIMGADFVNEVISACVPPVYPPRSGYGWARILVLPTFSKTTLETKAFLRFSKDAKPSSCSPSSTTPGNPLYPLEMNTVKHLVKLSPVRAVLACVFGSSILYSGSEPGISSVVNDGLGQAPDADRLFYEFALDQSERFPTLNRWIQMQTNLHRMSESATTPSRSAENANSKPEATTAVKRSRECDSDSESEIDDKYVSSHASTTSPELSNEAKATHDPSQDSPKSDNVEVDPTVLLSFDWENEGPYEKAVERLIHEGNLMDALALSDRCLRDGASDQLLQLLIECGEDNQSTSGQSQGYGAHTIWSNSWQYCLRLKDKQLAARLSLKYLHRWDLDAALDVLTMCNCHLLQSDPIKNEVVQMRRALHRYSHILSADDHFSSWQEVEVECKDDPEGLALRLAGKGAVSAALEVAESSDLSIDLRRELQGRQLVKLLTADPLNGGGPAEASRFLSSLPDPDDALPVAMGAMQLLPNLRSKQLLVHFFLRRRGGNLSDGEVSRLNSWAIGLRVLAALPLPWQQRCSSLHEHPHLIVEVLLMRKQLQSASLILKEFSSLRDNNLILAYSAKAITVSISSPAREPRISVSTPRPKQRTRAGMPTRSNFTSSLSNLHKEARRAFSWTARDTGSKTAPKEVYRKRKSSGLTPSDRVAWEAMTGIQEDHVSVFSEDGQERIPPVSIAEEWILTGDPKKDDAVRLSHRYESSPDVVLFKALLSLCSDESVSAKGALDLCINQMKSVLGSQQLPLHASMETLGRAYHETEIFVQGLIYAKGQLRKLSGSCDFPIYSERTKDGDEASSDAGSSSVSSQNSDEVCELLSQADMWLGRAELLQSLLGSGIVASLDDIADKESSARLRDRLIEDERYSMAVYTCKKCKIDAFPVWNAWGLALIRMEHYAQARVKFKQAFQLYKGDAAPVILEIINTMEGGPPVDVSAVRSMYEHLAKSAPTILDDSLSADSYLNVLYMPSTFPRSERSRRFHESPYSHSASSSLEFDDGPRSNLDNIRYVECVTYLQEYARQHMLGFMFRHGHYTDACMLFFPLNAVPSPLLPSAGAVTQSSSPQRPDPLATDYGTLDDLCDLCIGYDAMPVLEDVISTRMVSTPLQEAAVNQHTVASLVRICIYCETHRHFNYLYKFQVIKKDHVAAGLCCIQLFMNASSQEEAIRHLENAKRNISVPNIIIDTNTMVKGSHLFYVTPQVGRWVRKNSGVKCARVGVVSGWVTSWEAGCCPIKPHTVGCPQWLSGDNIGGDIGRVATNGIRADDGSPVEGGRVCWKDA